MLELGTDEITIVLQLAPSQKKDVFISTWEREAKNMILIFESKARFVGVFGDRMPIDSKPSGYTKAFAYGEHAFYLALAYHEMRMDMGVAVKFSAQALEFYLQSTEQQLYQFLQSIVDEVYTVRLSRIDLVADFIDESIDTTSLYKKLVKGAVVVATKHVDRQTGEYRYRKANMKIQGFAVGEKMPTVYLGSAKSDSQMRVYDKKQEQINRSGAKFDKAIACDNWTRFEAVFRNEYAHQLTYGLMRIKDDSEMSAFIASNIIQKYRLMYVEDGKLVSDLRCSRMLLDAANGLESCLRSPQSRTFDIVRNIGHVLNGSGTFSTLYKVYTIWGNDALDYMMAFLNDQVRKWVPNTDCTSWLRKNKSDTLAAHPSFEKLVEDYVKPMLEADVREGANDAG